MLTVEHDSPPAEVENEGGRAIVRLPGEVTLSVAAPLFAQVRALLDDQDAVTVDLVGVEQIDTSGVALLVNLALVAREGDIDLSFASPSEQAQRMIKLLGVGSLLLDQDPARDDEREERN